MNKKFLLIITIISSILLSCESTKNKIPSETKTDTVADVKKITNDEFERSTQLVDISIDDFNADKSAILKVIRELSRIMAEYNYNEWLNFIEPDSIYYWSNPNNLKNASKRLPVKSMTLNNLNDYFKFVFVPSRKGRVVDEIRYISLDQVKAVQTSENQDIVYYNFIKLNGKWMVKIPPLQN